MARKSGNGNLVELCGYITLVITGILYLVKAIFMMFGGSLNLGEVGRVLDLILLIAFVIGIGLAAYNYTVGRGKFIKILFWIALVSVLVFGVLGIWPVQIIK